MNPTVVAALIGEASKARDLAIKFGTKILFDKHKPLDCIVENNTPFNFEVYPGFGQPIHGNIVTPAPSQLLSLENAANRQPDGSYKEHNIAQWTLKGGTHGTQLVMAYRCKSPNFCVAFWAVNPATGSPSCAIQFGSGNWLEEQVAKHNGGNPGKAEWLRDHMKGGDTAFHAYAKHGEIKILTPFYGIKAVIAAGTTTLFTLEMELGSQDPRWKNVSLPKSSGQPGLVKQGENFLLQGRLMDNTGSPMPNYTVSAYKQDPVSQKNHLASTTSDALGNFRLKGKATDLEEPELAQNTELWFEVNDGYNRIHTTQDQPIKNIKSIPEPVILQL